MKDLSETISQDNYEVELEERLAHTGVGVVVFMFFVAFVVMAVAYYKDCFGNKKKVEGKKVEGLVEPAQPTVGSVEPAQPIIRSEFHRFPGEEIRSRLPSVSFRQKSIVSSFDEAPNARGLTSDYQSLIPKTSQYLL